MDRSKIRSIISVQARKVRDINEAVSSDLAAESGFNVLQVGCLLNPTSGKQTKVSSKFLTQ